MEPAFWVRIAVAVACGGIVGLERQLRNKPAGMRTSILVCVGTMTFVRTGIDLTTGVADPTRVLGQIVTGVGFLGGGVILTQGGLVKGVTSAAVVWLLAGIGATIGTDRHLAALALAVTTVTVLLGVEWLESVLRRVGLLSALSSGSYFEDPPMAREDGDDDQDAD